jgi:hypothetical protein
VGLFGFEVEPSRDVHQIFQVFLKEHIVMALWDDDSVMTLPAFRKMIGVGRAKAAAAMASRDSL